MSLVLAIFGGVAVFHGLFLGLYLMIKMSKDKNISNLFLGGILIGFSLRISKSIFYYLLGQGTILRVGMLLGLMGKLCIGPFIWFYIKSKLDKQFHWQPVYYIHFIPAFLVIALAWWISPNSWLRWLILDYRQTTILIGIYLAFSWYTWYKQKQGVKDHIARWLWVILTGSTLIWVAFVYQFFAGSLFAYSLGSLWAAAILYWIFYEGLNNPEVFKKPKRKSKKAPSAEVVQALKLKLQNAFQDEKVYKDSSITLSKLSQKLKTPSYLISQVINSQYQKSFPEFVNSYRIDEVKEKLKTAKDDFIKIEALAYEVGFNTPSAFYTAFKKETSLTPQEYKKQCQQLIENN